jgi:hypothetical protein
MFSEDTEILTDQGWKRISKLSGSELVMTLNPKTSEIEYQKPRKYYIYDYDGTMLHFQSKFINLLVTLNHQMFLRKHTKGFSKNNRPLVLVEASRLSYGKDGRLFW